MRLHCRAGHKQSPGDLEVGEVLAAQLHHVQFTRSQRGPARRGALALTSSARGIRDRLVKGEFGAFGPRGSEAVWAENIPGASDSTFVHVALRGEAGISESSANRLRGSPEPDRFLRTLLLRRQLR